MLNAGHQQSEAGDNRLLDCEGAAAYLATTPRHIRQLWEERRLTAVKLGRLVRFRRQDLDAYVERNVHPAVR
jgi:excisionase family DNA binding protein